MIDGVGRSNLGRCRDIWQCRLRYLGLEAGGIGAVKAGRVGFFAADFVAVLMGLSPLPVLI